MSRGQFVNPIWGLLLSSLFKFKKPHFYIKILGFFDVRIAIASLKNSIFVGYKNPT